MWNDRGKRGKKRKKCSLEIHRKLAANDFSEITLITAELKAPEAPQPPQKKSLNGTRWRRYPGKRLRIFFFSSSQDEQGDKSEGAFER